jgi:hypothetical protein
MQIGIFPHPLDSKVLTFFEATGDHLTSFAL